MDRLNLLTLAGTPRQRGRDHGEALRPAIHRLVEAWSEEIARETGLGLAAYLQRFAAETDFLPAIRRWTPDLLEEVGGIAEGAGLDAVACRSLQNMDEQWFHVELLQRCKCSTLAVVGRDGGARLGQNMDLPKYLDGFQTVLRIRQASRPEVLLSTFAGFIGLFGLNSRGVAVCVNNLPHLRAASTGLPVAYVIRGALDRGSAAEAARFIREVPHATGQSYLVGGPDGLFAMECSAGRVVQHAPDARQICHTNHPLTNDDLQPAMLGWDADRLRADLAFGRTLTRLRALERGLHQSSGSDAARFKQLLADRSHYLCRALDGPFEVFTFSSGVFELAPLPVAHLSSGPPTESSYRELRFGEATP